MQENRYIIVPENILCIINPIKYKDCIRHKSLIKKGIIKGETIIQSPVISGTIVDLKRQVEGKKRVVEMVLKVSSNGLTIAEIASMDSTAAKYKYIEVLWIKIVEAGLIC